MTSYINYINSQPVLSTEEEVSLFHKSKRGDITARSILITSNLRLVVKIAYKYKYTDCLDEVISAGTEGLIEAVDSYDFETDTFQIYAISYIKKYILNYYADRKFLISVPHNLQFTLLQINKYIDTYFDTYGEYPSNQNICQLFCDKLPKNFKYQNLVSYVSLTPSKDDNEDTSWELGSEDAFIQQYADMDETKTLVKTIKSILSSQQYTVLQGLYGLENTISCSKTSLAQQLNLSIAMINKIENNAIRILRKKLVDKVSFL